MARFRNFWAEEGGNTAMIFGLAIIPVLALSGGAVDLAHRADVRVQVQSAADAAALAAARAVQTGPQNTDEAWEGTRAGARSTATQVFNAGLTGISRTVASELEIDVQRDGIRFAADVGVPTTFLKLIGIDRLAADGFAEVELANSVPVEIALVLDYSGSMLDNDKYVRMTDAATAFIDQIAETRAATTQVAIVPFSSYVYATVPAGMIRGTPVAEAQEIVTACLMNRDYPYSADEESPQTGVDASRWPQADPESAECQDYGEGGLQVRDLTNDFAGLTSALAAMRPVNKTNISLATEMGWHVLSPAAPFDTARNYNASEVRKILILLTDGMQTIEAMGPGGGAPSREAADEVTAELCDNMATVGIQVFTIAYDIEQQRVRDLLSGCASANGGFHETQGVNDISGVFEDIYQEIAESVWLSR